ncbi:unnamed protein product [marine sediment metagenome]|uniref:Uncharacterized protein n=1 Tax=marine sediment metagenome TaxID=412755 RepID=X1DLK5_9ZZZZ
MHEKDRKKIMAAGFVLYRCSETERIVKRRKIEDLSWKLHARCKTKKRIKEIRLNLYDIPNAIQD